MRFLASVIKLFVVPLFLAGVAHGQCSITLDGIDGLYHGDTILSGQKVTFYLRYTNNTATNIYGFSNGYRVYSPDGGAWKSIKVDTIGLSRADFDLTLVILYRDTLNHTTPDTFGVGAVSMDSAGLRAGYDQRAVSITIDLGDSRAVGKHICIDSTFFPPGFLWLWVSKGNTNTRYYPSWDGPHCFYILESPTDVETQPDELPKGTLLSQNYPNPFNPSTTINFVLPRATLVTLSVTDILGREIVTLVDKVLGAGEHSVVWEGKDRTGNSISSGIYFYKLQTEDYTESRKMMLVK